MPAFESAAALARDAEVDAVIVATPPGSHIADAAAVASAGLLALVEKPPGVDRSSARALAALEPPPLLGLNRRFDPLLRALRARVPQQQPLQLELAFRYRRESWGAHDVADDALLDVGPHVLDLARWLTGAEIHSVRTSSLEHDRCELELELSRGTAVVVCDAATRYRETAVVHHPDGARIGRWMRGGLRDRIEPRLPGLGRPSPLVASLCGQLNAFCEAVAGRPAPDLATTADGVAVMDAIAAARASSRADGGWVEVAALDGTAD